MEQQDYLKRQIEQIGQVLGIMLSNLLGLKNSGRISAGIEMVNHSLKSELDFDTEELKKLPPDIFLDTLHATKKLNNENLEKLADILLLIADNEQKNDKAILYKKCLIIYEYLENTENVYSFDRQRKIDQLKNKACC